MNFVNDCASLSILIASPNPHVACTISTPDGQTAQGHTQRAGGAHAEVMALRDAAARGIGVKGATAFVTLEPCSHHGRTPPCCDALIGAGIAKVVVAILDPNPLVAGRGVARLRAAGIEVQVLPKDSAEAIACRELNIGFFSRMVRKTPWLRLKIAASLDGQTALANGQSQWITGKAARADGHAYRARACAVLTGIGTVLADDPLLNVRLVDAPRQPHVVVVDSQLEIPLSAKLLTEHIPHFPDDANHSIANNDHMALTLRKIFIYCTKNDPAKQAALEKLGATVIHMPETLPHGEKQVNGKVDLAAMLRDLAAREINELHVEAGQKLNGSLIRAGLVDEFLVYQAPTLLGAGLGMANLGPFETLVEGLALRYYDVQRVGDDLRLVLRAPGRDQF
jgi:diaminohydroxyphosphoribosylaminopyrimidine deaminase / 5-amino-6-(5-phosphoribosylamino)uracil reductase